MDIEGYYKNMKNLPIINREKQFSSDPDLIAGDGESYGWEFLITSQLDLLRFTGSYTLSWAYNEVDNWKFYPRYDSRHTVKLLFEYNLGSGWLFSGTWIYNTGYPFTPTIGYYDRLNSVNFVSWDIYESYAPFLLLR